MSIWIQYRPMYPKMLLRTKLDSSRNKWILDQWWRAMSSYRSHWMSCLKSTAACLFYFLWHFIHFCNYWTQNMVRSLVSHFCWLKRCASPLLRSFFTLQTSILSIVHFVLYFSIDESCFVAMSEDELWNLSALNCLTPSRLLRIGPSHLRASWQDSSFASLYYLINTGNRFGLSRK